MLPQRPRIVLLTAEDGARLRGVPWVTLAAIVPWSAHLALVVAAVPYHQWDELAFGEWSRLIAASGQLRFPSITSLTYQRPLFYVLQGWLWRLLGEDELWGRLLSVGFLVVLIASVYRLGGFVGGPGTQRERGALAVLVLLGVTEVAGGAGAALTDVPVAAMIAAAAAVLWTTSGGWRWGPGLAAVAAAAMLLKPTALFALAGLAAAHVLGPRQGWRARMGSVVWLGLGVALALAYSSWMAATLGQPLHDFFVGALREGYYADLGRQLRWPRVLGVRWLSPWLSVPLLTAIAYAAIRLGGGTSRTSLRVALPLALVGSWMAGWLAPLPGAVTSLAGVVKRGWEITLVLAAVLAAGSHAPAGAAPSRLWLLRLVVWAVPPVAGWAFFTPYDMRLISPAWAPLVLLCTVPLALGLAGWLRTVPAVGYPLLLVLPALAVTNARTIDRLDLDTSLRILRTASTSGWDRGAVRRVLLPDLEASVAVLRPLVRPGDRIASPEGRLRYDFPGRANQFFPAGCAELAGHRFFVLPDDPAIRRHFVNYRGVPGDPDFWGACREPRLERIPAPGRYAVFEIGEARGRTP